MNEKNQRISKKLKLHTSLLICASRLRWAIDDCRNESILILVKLLLVVGTCHFGTNYASMDIPFTYILFIVLELKHGSSECKF